MDIMQNDLQCETNTPPAPCSVCGNTFQPTDDLDFICRDCQHALIGHCGCGFDDVHMDWGINLDSDFVYFWRIECICGNELKSGTHPVNEQSNFAKQLHAEWTKNPTAADDRARLAGYQEGTGIV